jgi:hypothetical protein
MWSLPWILLLQQSMPDKALETMNQVKVSTLFQCATRYHPATPLVAHRPPTKNIPFRAHLSPRSLQSFSVCHGIPQQHPLDADLRLKYSIPSTFESTQEWLREARAWSKEMETKITTLRDSTMVPSPGMISHVQRHEWCYHCELPFMNYFNGSMVGEHKQEGITRVKRQFGMMDVDATQFRAFNDRVGRHVGAWLLRE